ncbi:MAG: DKNYY domain-containing protein [Candidatus Kapaibacterium sp.]
MKYNLIYLLLMLLTLTSCQNGYEKIDDNWYYITFDEGAGKRENQLYAHLPTFKVLDNSDYAKDKDSVYFEGRIIKGAHSASFRTIGNTIYSLDKKNVYIYWYKIPNADPNSFEILETPYSKDKNRIFCGNISLKISKVEKFELLNFDGYSIMDTSVFNKRFSNLILDRFEIETIVYSDANALINGKRYKGIELIE